MPVPGSPTRVRLGTVKMEENEERVEQTDKEPAPQEDKHNLTKIKEILLNLKSRAENK